MTKSAPACLAAPLSLSLPHSLALVGTYCPPSRPRPLQPLPASPTPPPSRRTPPLHLAPLADIVPQLFPPAPLQNRLGRALRSTARSPGRAGRATAQPREPKSCYSPLASSRPISPSRLVNARNEAQRTSSASNSTTTTPSPSLRTCASPPSAPPSPPSGRSLPPPTSHERSGDPCQAPGPVRTSSSDGERAGDEGSSELGQERWSPTQRA